VKSRAAPRLLWGSEAVAIGLVQSGLEILSAHESVKAGELAIACEAAREGARPAVEVHLSAARSVESAIAAASQGRPAAVVLPSRALASGAAPLHAFCERGTTAGLVVVLIEDPGCEMTPGEIDSRYLARELYMPILEPGSLDEALSTAREAPFLSEQWGQPVMLRLGLRLMDTRGLIEVPSKGPAKKSKAPRAEPPVTATPLGSFGGEAVRAARIRRLEAIGAAVESIPLNRVELTPPSDLVIVTVGAAWGPTRDALQLIGMEGTAQLVKIGTPYPLPRQMLTNALRRARRALVIEELEPFVESRLCEIVNKEGLPVSVRGEVFFARGGELTTWDVADGLGRFTGLTPPVDDKRIEMLDKLVAQALPPRAPFLPEGHGIRVAIEAAAAFAASSGAQYLVEAPPEWRAALFDALPLYFGDWGEGLGVGTALARRSNLPIVVVTEGRGVVAGLSAVREAQAEGLPLLAIVSPQGLAAAVDRALPGAAHHSLNLRALATALGLDPAAIIDLGGADRKALTAALSSAASGKGPRVFTFSAATEDGRSRP
jgi:TPP-dependent indolepyruvate ferredoxin oxidoreductase alpha subunit